LASFLGILAHCAAVLMKIQVFWDVTLYRLINLSIETA
jgi:hypothetical protein